MVHLERFKPARENAEVVRRIISSVRRKGWTAAACRRLLSRIGVGVSIQRFPHGNARNICIVSESGEKIGVKIPLQLHIGIIGKVNRVFQKGHHVLGRVLVVVHGDRYRLDNGQLILHIIVCVLQDNPVILHFPLRNHIVAVGG